MAHARLCRIISNHLHLFRCNWILYGVERVTFYYVRSCLTLEKKKKLIFFLFLQICQWNQVSLDLFSSSIVIFHHLFHIFWAWSEPSMRGMMSTIALLSYNLGILIVLGCGLVLPWRKVAFICALFPLSCLFAVLFVTKCIQILLKMDYNEATDLSTIFL